MKPIAVVYWVDEGKERKMRIYDQEELDWQSRILKERNTLHWICICNGRAIVPSDKRKGTVDRFKLSGHTKGHPTRNGA